MSPKCALLYCVTGGGREDKETYIPKSLELFLGWRGGSVVIRAPAALGTHNGGSQPSVTAGPGDLARLTVVHRITCRQITGTHKNKQKN